MSWLSKMFGGNQKRDTTYTGAEPVTSLTKVPGGKEYYDAILGRLQGRDVGFGGQYADKYSSPIIANMRNQFTGYQLPELKSELSASGRRKGSAGFDQIRRAYQEQGLNEGDVFSRLQQRNEDQMRNEINDALGRTGDFAKGEANLIANKSAFDQGNYQNQLAQADKQRDAGNAAFQRLIGVGTTLLPTSLPSFGTSMATGGGQSYLSQNYQPTSMQRFGQNYLSPFAKQGQQGGVSAYSTRLKY